MPGLPFSPSHPDRSLSPRLGPAAKIKEDVLPPLPGLARAASPPARTRPPLSPVLQTSSLPAIPDREQPMPQAIAPAAEAVYAGGKHHGRSSMPQLRLLLCCLSLLFLAAPAMAEEDELAPGFDRCMEQSGGVTMEMMGCFQQAYDYWDARLNANYKKARQACQNSSDPKGWSDKLLKGQRAWVQYKELFADLVQLPNEGGSMARLSAMSFLTGETRKQALLLEQLVIE